MSDRNQAGMALLVVLSAIAFLLPLVYSGVEMGRFHQRRAENEIALQEARRLAESALPGVVAALAADGGLSQADHLGEAWAGGAALADPEAGGVSVTVEDAARYWNLNDLVRDGKADPLVRELLARLLNHLEMDGGLLDALVDWMDADDEPTGLGGAESGWYPGDGRPYAPVNGPLGDLAELLMVRGWDRTALERIRPFVRTGGGCVGSGLNVNTAAPETLAILDREVDVARLVAQRAGEPFASVAAIKEAAVVADERVMPLLRVNSGCFLVRIRCRVGGISGVLDAWLRRDGQNVSVERVWWSG